MQKSDRSVVILIGGNLGNKLQNIQNANVFIESIFGPITNRSNIYESTAWGFESADSFLNQVLVVESKLSNADLLKACHEIENKFDRVRNPDFYISRTMDVDILFIDNCIIETKNLTVPHLQLHKRMFTLAPLEELLPNFIHPKLHRSIKELKMDCEDQSEVSIFAHQ